MRTGRTKPWRRCYGYILKAPPREDGALSIVEVNPAMGMCWTSMGEELVINSERLLALVEQVVQERCAVTIRTWWTPEGVELMQLRRAPRDGWPQDDDKKAPDVF